MRWVFRWSSLSFSYPIPPGTCILPQIGAVLWDEMVFPEPMKFKPDRFLDSGGNLIKREEFIPFSMGKRSCLGESLARMELFIMFATLMQKFQFKAVDDVDLPTLEPAPGVFRACQKFHCFAVECD